MRPGARIGEFTVVERIDAVGPVVRWRVERADGKPMEALALAPDATDDEREAFERTHASLTEPLDGVLATAWRGTVEGSDVAVRAFVEATPPPSDVAAIRRALPRLVTAVLSAGPSTNATLAARDVLWTRDGPVLAPWGVVHPEDAPFAAPEAHRGAPPDGRAGLYGLGVVLYEALTGHRPLPAGVPTNKGSPIRATAWRADLPTDVADALARLLDHKPSRRDEATEVLDPTAPEVAPATLVPGSLVLTTGADPAGGLAGTHRTSANARLDRVPPKAVVTLTPRVLGRLPPRERSIAAGWANRPDGAVRRAIETGRPLAMAHAATAAAARKRARQIQNQTNLPLEVVTPPSALGTLAILFVATAATLIVAAGLALGVWWLGLVAAALYAASLAGAALWARSASRFRQAVLAAQASPATIATSPSLRAAWERAAALRRQLHGLDLPLAADADVRDAVTQVEDRIAEIARVDAAVDDALTSADPAVLRRRLAAATRRAASDASAATERDELARALADIEAVEARRQGIEADLSEVHSALSALEEALPVRGTPIRVEKVLNDVEASARRARRTVTGADE